MKKLSAAVSLMLAGLAAIAWFYTSVMPSIPGSSFTSYPAVQVPLAITLSAAACFGWLMTIVCAKQRERETRCRACGYILRGLSEPRCPECGERI